jgi:3-oxoacyl-[acyl-carrier protein] reductase
VRQVADRPAVVVTGAASGIGRAMPLGRIATPDAIAGVACRLLGNDAAYVNGQVIAVDGGATVL